MELDSTNSWYINIIHLVDLVCKVPVPVILCLWRDSLELEGHNNIFVNISLSVNCISAPIVEVTIDQVNRSKEYGFRVVFSPNHHWHSLVHDLLDGSGIIMSTPINFPDGKQPCGAIAKQAEIAYKAGCRSVDMRPDMDAFEMRDWDKLADSVRAVVENFGDGEVKAIKHTVTE